MAGATTKFLYTNFDGGSEARISDQPQEESSTASPDTTSNYSHESNSQPNSFLRRLHTKSRRGCLNCKKRRIKCPENHPACTQCAKRGLSCEWPEILIEQAGSNGRKTSLALPRQIDSPNTFSMQDFRLFNHFIREAHPFHPIGNADRWKHDIPSIAHNHDFLLHSMLGLAASDIVGSCPTDKALAYAAMKHRVLAIQALNAALSHGVHTMEEGNAMLATCYALVFQSALIADGFPEYMSFIRGCMAIAWQMGVKQLRFIFDAMLGHEMLAKMGPHLMSVPNIDPAHTRAAIVSLEACEHLIEKDFEKSFHSCCLEIARASGSSSREAYQGIMKIYSIFAFYMPIAEFQDFIDPANQTGLLLQAHLIALQTILDSVLRAERAAAQEENPLKMRHEGSAAWLASIGEKVAPEMMQWIAWPMSRARELRQRRAQELRGQQMVVMGL